MALPLQDKVQAENAVWITALLQLNDTFYPTGTYAHSFGLEGLIAESIVNDRETFRCFLTRSALPSLCRNELPIVVHAYRAFEADDWGTIGMLCELSAATKSARELRFAAENIGRQRAELAAKLRSHPVAVKFVEQAARERWPHSPYISAALEAYTIGAPLEAALSSVIYGTLAALMAAAMKLLRLGQNGAQTLLTELVSQSGQLIRTAKSVPVEEIGWYNPWLDIASARHETADARLFIS